MAESENIVRGRWLYRAWHDHGLERVIWLYSEHQSRRDSGLGGQKAWRKEWCTLVCSGNRTAFAIWLCRWPLEMAPVRRDRMVK